VYIGIESLFVHKKHLALAAFSRMRAAREAQIAHVPGRIEWLYRQPAFGCAKKTGDGLFSGRDSATSVAAYVGAVVHAFEANLGGGGISLGQSCGQIRPNGRNAQHPATARKDLFALAPRSGVKDLHTRSFAETG